MSRKPVLAKACRSLSLGQAGRQSQEQRRGECWLEMLGDLVSRPGSVNKSPGDLEPVTLLKVELGDRGLF